jgi:NAD(P)-dependent dehydrogenase (short-subunit alcohol dehydrogenase family)
MTGKTALIVGASRGIGLGLVEEYVGRGWSVTGTVRDDAAAAAVGRAGGEVERVDLADHDAIAALAGRWDRPLDLLFLNSGVNHPEDMLNASPEEIGRAMHVNAFGPAKLAWRLIERVTPRTGVVAFMNTGMGSIADNTSGGWDVYRASKAAQNMLARSLWAVAARPRGVTVLCINPGWVKTDMGGPHATIDVPTSTGGIADQIDQRAGSGEHVFIGWNGREWPW